MGTYGRGCYRTETEEWLPGLVIVNTHDIEEIHADAHYAAVLASPTAMYETITEIDDQLFAYDAHQCDDNNSSKFQ